MTRFSNRLRELRKNENLTQETLAKRIGISRGALSMYECGKREPDLTTLEIFADYFNVDMDYLLGLTNKTTVLPERKELPLSEPERTLLGYFRALPDFERGMLLGYAQRLYDEDRKKDTSTDVAM